MAPVEQVEIEVIGAQSRKASGASAADAGRRSVRRPHLRDQKDGVAPACDGASDEFLGLAAAVDLGRVNERQPKRGIDLECLLLFRRGALALADA